MKKWRLGLDLGTNSLGWTALELDSENNPINLINMGVRIFSDGRDPKTKEPLAKARRDARGIRRNIFRRKLRRRRLFRLLQNENLLPQKREKAQELKTLNPYELRVKALDEILKPEDLGRVLFHLGVRRGFKSNRKDIEEETKTNEKKTEKKELSKMTQAEKSQSLVDTIQESGNRTLGEFLWNKHKEGKIIRFVPEVSEFYPLRSLYKDEFDKIKTVQEKKYKNLNWDAIERAIFYQRPLRRQERGKCQFLPEYERTFKAMPSSNRFRILQDVYNLAMYDELNKKISLSEKQIKDLVKYLDQKEKANFDTLRRYLKVPYRFNLETENRLELKGNGTSVKMRKESLFGDTWDVLSLQEQDLIVEKMITADEDEEVLEILNNYDLTEEQKKEILKINFPSGTTSFSKEFTQKIVARMEEKQLQYHEACLDLGFNHSEQKIESYDLLPYYGKVLQGSTMGGKFNDFGEDKPEQKYGKIGNPSVHVALNQTRVVVNALIKEYGKPEQIVIELTRDLKASKDSKIKILKKQSENAKRNVILNQNIQDLNQNIQYPSRFERQKYKLWEELGREQASRLCIYCGKNISASELFGSNIEVEHILPFSRTLLNAESNLTIAHRSCNAFKAEKSPYEAFSSNPKGYNWEEIMARVRNLSNKTKQSRFSEDAMKIFEKESGFIARQLTDNAYISRISMRYLKAICDNVWAVNGAMTKFMRDKWEIDSILKRKINQDEIAHFGLKGPIIGEYKKNRYDHRHHALDSFVIAFMDRSFVQKIASLNARSMKHRLEAPTFPIAREELLEKIKNIVVSFKPDHGPEGKLSKETYLGKIKTQTLIATSSLAENDISTIRSPIIKKELEQKIAEFENFKTAIQELAKTHPEITVFNEQFVTRMPISSIKTEAHIGDIVDTRIRQELQTHIASNPGQNFEDLRTQFFDKKGIKKIRCTTRIQAPIIIEPNKNNPLSVHRYLNPEDYFTAIIWKIPPAKEGKPSKFEAQYVRRTEIDKNKKPIENKPHPAAKKICTLYKHDYIEFSENGVWKKARIAGYAATKNQIDIRPIFASGTSIKDWVISASEQCLEKGWKEVDKQNFVSVNIFFGEKDARKITVSPIGKVFRKN